MVFWILSIIFISNYIRKKRFVFSMQQWNNMRYLKLIRYKVSEKLINNKSDKPKIKLWVFWLDYSKLNIFTMWNINLLRNHLFLKSLNLCWLASKYYWTKDFRKKYIYESIYMRSHGSRKSLCKWSDIFSIYTLKIKSRLVTFMLSNLNSFLWGKSVKKSSNEFKHMRNNSVCNKS